MNKKTKYKNVREDIYDMLTDAFYKVDRIRIKRINFSAPLRPPTRTIDEDIIQETVPQTVMNVMDRNVFDTVLATSKGRRFGVRRTEFNSRADAFWDLQYD